MQAQVPAALLVTQIVTTCIIAVVGGFISWNQLRLARNKLKYELFDRRMAVYLTAKKLVSTYSEELLHPEHEYREFVSAIDTAKFLFGPEIPKHLVVMRNALLHSVAARTNSEAPSDEVERLKAVADQRHNQEVLFAASDQCVDIFAPYLRMDEGNFVRRLQSAIMRAAR